ncbi:MAG: hypothetical protein Q9184_008208, partial [Pyrenodesmia sp. 2 TL-2023]
MQPWKGTETQHPPPVLGEKSEKLPGFSRNRSFNDAQGLVEKEETTLHEGDTATPLLLNVDKGRLVTLHRWVHYADERNKRDARRVEITEAE